jgi:predicted metal-dependent phosphotriesterase family hydrolase
MREINRMIVHTVPGDISPAALGPSDAHEHLFAPSVTSRFGSRRAGS